MGSTGRADQSHLVARQTVEAGCSTAATTTASRHRTFLYADKRSARMVLPAALAVQRLRARRCCEARVGDRPTVFWVYPTNDNLPALADALEPDLVVADVVDDNRTWYRPGSHRLRSSRAQLPGDPRPQRRRARQLRAGRRAHDGVRARGPPRARTAASSPTGAPPAPRRRSCGRLAGPIIGYVGNLSDRIDIDLLDDLARARPDWQFVFVGSAHLDQSILRLDRHPNVHFVGVKPYEEAKRFIEHFDVALIPHLDNEMTRSMNPLKAFVYCAAGVPVVSTPIANIDELGDLITVAKGLDGFLAAIEEALTTGVRGPDLEVLEPHAWERRVEQVIALIDEASGAMEPR